jgi:Leucine-rich repeat (LRR) protein
MSNFEMREDNNGIGKVLILKGAWSDDVGAYMRKNHIYALRLTDSFGSKGYDISFLNELSFLRSLELYCWEAKGIKVIESLPQLEVLGLQFKSVQKIDFSAFTNLRVVLVTWSKGLGSLLELTSIEKLNIQNYPHNTLEPIFSMSSLRQLYLRSRKLESLKGIEQLGSLELLDLYNCPFLT